MLHLPHERPNFGVVQILWVLHIQEGPNAINKLADKGLHTLLHPLPPLPLDLFQFGPLFRRKSLLPFLLRLRSWCLRRVCRGAYG